MKVKTAIVGLGKVAHLHAKGLVNAEHSEFTAVCSRSINKAQEFAAQYGVQPYDDLEQMIHETDIQVLVICTPHPFHADPVLTAAQHGVHSLIEKPMAASLQDCDAMLESAEKHNVTLGVVSQRRFYEPVQRMRKAIDKGKIGIPVLGNVIMYGWRDRDYYDSDAWRGTWDLEGGGVLVNQAPHQLDLFQWFMGDIDQVFGVWKNLNHPYIQVEDTAVAVVSFKNNAVGNIVVTNSQKPGLYGKVHVNGNNGAMIGAQTEGGAMFIAGTSDIQEPPLNDIWTISGEEQQLTNISEAGY
ncbi:MAG: Gfo/Idh/MocA family oxidoreductase [candidate division KSB1 bacterium]|nr:Gfo/Idh/MocA family oxidoreductase [candidate division KSB1 bacterium]